MADINVLKARRKVVRDNVKDLKALNIRTKLELAALKSQLRHNKETLATLLEELKHLNSEIKSGAAAQ
jgi:hypothetical protein